MRRGLVKPSVAQEVEEELAFHVEMRVRELIADGWTEEDARAEALERFGDMERVKANLRDLGTGRDVRMGQRMLLGELGQDVAYAMRRLLRAPAFALVTILTLAIAIGANSAVFTVLNAVLLRPLPYPEHEDLAVVWTRYLPVSGFDIAKFPTSGPEWLDYRETTTAFESIGALSTTTRTLTGDGADAERIRMALVSRDVFPALGVQPEMGRWIGSQDDVPDGPSVVVIGHGLWTTRYGGDPGILGRTILLNGVAAEVVGVMPDGFAFPSEVVAWMPLGIDRSNEGGRGAHGLVLIGRLAAGKTMDDARAELDVVADRWAAEHQHNVGHFLWSQTLQTELVADAPRTLALLMAAVGLVLLVACANVANLLLAHGERRHVEVGVRAALGAGRGRITRQLATESVVLAAVAGALGLLLAIGGVRALVTAYPSALPRLQDVRADGTVLLFTLSVTALTVLLFGIVPAYLAGRRATATLASSVGRSVGGRRTSALRRLLVTCEVAVSLVVLILAGLVVRTFSALSSADPGVDAENLLTFSITLPASDYPDVTTVPLEYERLLDRIRAIPGVTDASAGSYLPFSGGQSYWDFQLDDRPPRAEGDQAWSAAVVHVAPGYFETLGIPVVEGRSITETDGADAPLVAVASELMASRYWPGESAIGKRFGYTVQPDSIPWMTIVGIVPDPVVGRVDEEPYPHVYLPERQAAVSSYDVPRTLTVAVRTGVEPDGLTPAVRSAVAEFDPDLPLYRVGTMEAQIAESTSETRITATLLAAFGVIALVLAAVGIYGVISYSVSGRTREIGVRVALGAERGSITRMVLSEGARPVVAGVAIGLAGAWLSTRLVESMLHGVAPTDPLTFTVLPLGLVAIGAVASWLPALRATRVSPTEALRAE